MKHNLINDKMLQKHPERPFKLPLVFDTMEVGFAMNKIFDILGFVPLTLTKTDGKFYITVD